ncbi:MAG: hypothetical protein M0Z30_13625 [Actinomycetota bacterium]|nr:hypothetical protein [Actinomycetota bacterium]
MSRRHGITERVDKARSVLQAFSIPTPGGVQFRLDVEATRGWLIQAIP